MYKVCRCINGKYFSSVIVGPETVEYKLGEYVYGSNGQFLFVFDNLESAQYFTKNSLDCVIFECEVLGLETKKPETQVIKIPAISDLPKGTLFAYGVKITKLVEEYPLVEGRKWYFVNRRGDVVIGTENNVGVVRFDTGTSVYYIQHKNHEIYLGPYNLNKWSSGNYLTHDESLAKSISQVINVGVFNHE